MASINLTGSPSTITVRQGNTVDLVFKFNVKSSTTGMVVGPVDITDYDFRMNLKKGTEVLQLNGTPVSDSADDAALYNLPVMYSSISVDDGPNGVFKLYISAIYTKKMRKGDWAFEIEYVSPENNAKSFMTGDFTVEQDIK